MFFSTDHEDVGSNTAHDISGGNAMFMDVRDSAYSVYASSEKLWMQNHCRRKYQNVSAWLNTSDRLKVNTLEGDSEHLRNFLFFSNSEFASFFPKSMFFKNEF